MTGATARERLLTPYAPPLGLTVRRAPAEDES